MNRTFQDNRSKNSFNSRKRRHASFKPITNPRRRIFKRTIPQIGRNRLQRVQNMLNRTTNFRRLYQGLNVKSVNLNNNTIVNNNREIYVKGLPRFVDNTGLFNLFKNEGRIIKSNILYDNVGFSRGIGRILFTNFRDAMNVIKKWNNTVYKGNTLKVEYKTAPNVDNRNNAYNGKFVKNNNVNRNNNDYFRSFNFKQGDKCNNNFRPNYYNNRNKNDFRYGTFRNNY